MCQQSSIASFFTNLNLWTKLKDVLFGQHVIADKAFKFTTKYSVFMLFFLMCATFNAGLKCDGSGKNNYEEYCLNKGTFLVVKALTPEMKGKVLYPGVCLYDRERDEILQQQYYKQLPTIYASLIAIAIVPSLLWKVIFLN